MHMFLSRIQWVIKGTKAFFCRPCHPVYMWGILFIISSEYFYLPCAFCILALVAQLQKKISWHANTLYNMLSFAFTSTLQHSWQNDKCHSPNTHCDITVDAETFKYRVILAEQQGVVSVYSEQAVYPDEVKLSKMRYRLDRLLNIGITATRAGRCNSVLKPTLAVSVR